MTITNAKRFKWSLIMIALMSWVILFNSQANAVEFAELEAGVTQASDAYGHAHPCPESGVWPEGCVPQTGGDSGNSGGNVCPESGVWPPGCTPSTGGNSTPPSGGNNGNVCPESGVWPPGCTPSTGGDPTPPSGGNSGGGAGQPCPTTGVWPPGCIPPGGGSPSGDTQQETQQQNTPPPPSTGVSDQQLIGLLDQAVNDLNVYWDVEMGNFNMNYRQPRRVTRYEGDPDSPPNAFYIPTLHYIAMDMRLLREVSYRYG